MVVFLVTLKRLKVTVALFIVLKGIFVLGRGSISRLGQSSCPKESYFRPLLSSGIYRAREIRTAK